MPPWLRAQHKVKVSYKFQQICRLLTVEIVVFGTCFWFRFTYYRFLPFHACKLYFCRSCTSESCITVINFKNRLSTKRAGKFVLLYKLFNMPWVLTRWWTVYECIVPGFRHKTSSFQLPYQRHNSFTNCARELFKGSNGSASLLVCTRKKIFWLGLRIFCEWHHNWSSFRVILAHVAWPKAQPLGQSVSLKFSLETRLDSESFEPLIDFLAFLVQKLWSKINRLIN